MKLISQNGYPSPWPEMPDYDEHPRTAYCGFLLIQD